MNSLDFFHLEGTGKLPTIFQHTDAQLNAAIKAASDKHPDFFVLLHGIDAYMERRRRRMKAARERRTSRLALFDPMFQDNEHMWGNS